MNKIYKIFKTEFEIGFWRIWPLIVNIDKVNFVSFLAFVGVAASFKVKITSFETVAKREAILNSVPKQLYPRILWVTGANQNARKLLSTELIFKEDGSHCGTMSWMVTLTDTDPRPLKLLSVGPSWLILGNFLRKDKHDQS